VKAQAHTHRHTYLIRHITGVVFDDELLRRFDEDLIAGMTFASFVQLFKPRLVSAFGHLQLFVDRRQNTLRFLHAATTTPHHTHTISIQAIDKGACSLPYLLDEVEHRLVINVIDTFEVDFLLAVHRLFEFERVRIEELLQLLIAVVNAQLLEVVHLENLETEDICDACDVMGCEGMQVSGEAERRRQREGCV
jgi:hypothetical protein